MHKGKIFAKFSAMIRLKHSGIEFTLENLLMFTRAHFIRLKNQRVGYFNN